VQALAAKEQAAAFWSHDRLAGSDREKPQTIRWIKFPGYRKSLDRVSARIYLKYQCLAKYLVLESF
jgi:hypothetical protein